MKNNGLQNRFGPEVEEFWNGWYECLECGKNHADCLHHCISPTATCFVKGDHNTSIFNSVPLNNYECHLGKPLQNMALQKKYLNRTALIVAEASQNGEYRLTKKDYAFLRVYKDMYELSTLSLFDFTRVDVVK